MPETASVLSSPDTPPLQAPIEEAPTIATRFGDFTIDDDKIITFAKGLYGFEQQHQFMLTNVPNWPSTFKLLQAIDDPALGLIVLPLKDAGEPIDRKDFTEACDILGYDHEKTAILGLVTMRPHSQDHAFTVNLKAPLLIETEKRQGCQHVFSNDKYLLRHPLPVDEQQGG